MVAFDFKLQVIEKGKPSRFVLNEVEEEKISFEELLQYTKESLIKISTEALAEEQAKGFDKNPVRIVDNKYNAPIESVNPLGKIEFVASQNLSEIALFIYDAIDQRSKVGTGLYKKFNIVSMNGIVIALNRKELVDYFIKNPYPKTGDKLRFINATPYARKLERYSKYAGKTATGVKWRKSTDKQGRSGLMRKYKYKDTVKEAMHVLAENGTYFLSSRAALNKYRGNAFIKYESLPGHYLGIENLVIMGPKGKPLRRTFKGKNTPYLYPTILIYVHETGLNKEVVQ
jgi:hypothetical protein